MTNSPDRRRASAHSLSTAGTLLALACAKNVYAVVDRRSPEAGALATWLGQSATAFGLPDSALSSDDDEPGRSRRRGVELEGWRNIRGALDWALADLPSSVDAPAERWIAAIGTALQLDSLAKRILALTIHYKVDQRVERLFDSISACRGGHSMLHRGAGLFGLLLDEPTAEVAAQFMSDAKLLASRLLRLDEHGEISVLDRLLSLIRQEVLPAADFYDQLLGSIEADPLPSDWDSFAHLGREAEVAASLLQAAMGGRESGVSILLYGPPGTGKTSLAATLAARVGARLRPICEADERGGEPSRSERLAGLRLAQRLATPSDTLLLFDEAEDIFVGASAGFGTHTTGSRVFIHRLLERLTVPVIWTANDFGVLGPAVLRRMTMCLELKVPNVAMRTVLWRCMGEVEGIALKDADAARLASLVPAAPAVASAALRATRLVGGGAEARLGSARSVVGGTERNIAGALAEAPEAQAFLVFDEADSLLLEREDAVRTWEISQVNEILTWMEGHALPFACTTNLAERLDRASLRRFLFKLRFDCLTTAQARLAFRRFFSLPPPGGLDDLRTLTPADFALVRRRAAVRGGEAKPDVFLGLLAAECEGRVGERGRVGFVASELR